MNRQKVYCYTCDVDVIITVTEKDFEEKAEYCPFCTSEFYYEDEEYEEDEQMGENKPSKLYIFLFIVMYYFVVFYSRSTDKIKDFFTKKPVEKPLKETIEDIINK